MAEAAHAVFDVSERPTLVAWLRIAPTPPNEAAHTSRAEQSHLTSPSTPTLAATTSTTAAPAARTSAARSAQLVAMGRKRRVRGSHPEMSHLKMPVVRRFGTRRQNGGRCWASMATANTTPNTVSLGSDPVVTV